MFVDSSQAHALAIKHIKEWSSQGNSLHKQLTQIIRSALSAVGNGGSPSKAIKKTERDLKTFFSQPSVSGAIIETHGRKLEFFLSHPESIQEGLTFVLISGQFNGRTGASKIEVKRSLVITIHALMRLHQRIGVLNPTVVLSEIYDAVGGCQEIIRAAKEIDAKSCPILSKNGLFITVPIKNSEITTLVTWISFDQLSRKWGVVVDALKEIQQSKPSLLNDEKYLIEFLASFRWIRQPHDQGADTAQAAWAETATNELVKNRLDATLIDQKKLTAIENDLTQSLDSGKTPEIETEIDLLIQDQVNSTDISSPKTNDRCHGIVVRKTPSGHVIVSLFNGWFGSISPIGLEKANSVREGLGDLHIGEPVSVEVRNLHRSDIENSNSISLDLTEKVDAEWELVEEQFPTGRIIECLVIGLKENRYILKVCTGIYAELSRKEMTWSADREYEGNQLMPGQCIRAMVTSINKEKRLLKVSMKLASENPWEKLKRNNLLDRYLTGVVFKVSPTKIYVRLPIGIDGIINTNHAGNIVWPTIGSAVNLEVLKIDFETEKIFLTPSKNDVEQEGALNVMSRTPDQWELAHINYSIGTVHQGRVEQIFPKGIGVTLSGGVWAYLPNIEISWDKKIGKIKNQIKKGQILNLTIIGIDPPSRSITVSYRQQTHNPWQTPEIDALAGHIFQGVVVNIVDFGVFILLPCGIEGLLHKSLIPTGRQFQKNEAVKVKITTVDIDKKRVVLELSDI